MNPSQMSPSAWYGFVMQVITKGAYSAVTQGADSLVIDTSLGDIMFHADKVIHVSITPEDLANLAKYIAEHPSDMPFVSTPITINWLQDTLDDQINPRPETPDDESD